MSGTLSGRAFAGPTYIPGLTLCTLWYASQHRFEFDYIEINEGITIFTDVVYLILPVVFLWNVQLKKGVKYGIWGVLSVGCV